MKENTRNVPEISRADMQPLPANSCLDNAAARPADPRDDEIDDASDTNSSNKQLFRTNPDCGGGGSVQRNNCARSACRQDVKHKNDGPKDLATEGGNTCKDQEGMSFGSFYIAYCQSQS